MTVAEHPGESSLRPGSWATTRRNTRAETVDMLFSTLLLPVDFVALLAAFITAYSLHASPRVDGLIGLDSYVTWLFLLTPLWVLVFALSGLYTGPILRARRDEVGKVFVAVSAGVMLLLVSDYFCPLALFPSQAMLVVGVVLSFAFVLVGREAVRSARRALLAREFGVRRAVVIGSGPVAQQVVESLTFTPRSGYRVVGVIDQPEQSGQSGMTGVPVYQSLNEAQQALGGQFDEFIEADSRLRQADRLNILRFAADHHFEYRMVPSQFGFSAPNAAVTTLAGRPVVTFRQTPLEGWGRVFKRAFDIIGSAVGLVVLAPVLAGVALLISILDPGPFLFKQLRLGRAAEPFHIYKFRTMQVKYSGRSPLEVFAELGRDDLVAEFLVDQKVKDDPRVTRLGAFLRKSSLDELPQLWNVLVGHLSLVGPRPIVRDELPKFGEWSATIFALKPGVTGLWQISGRNDIDYAERVRLNISYVHNWNLWLDVRILVRTVLILVRGGGAY